MMAMARRMDFEVDQQAGHRSDSPQSRLEDVILEKDLTALKGYLAEEKDNITEDELSNAFCFSVKKADIPKIEALLEAGADVNAQNAGGQLGLHLAVHRGRPDIVRRLLAAACNVTQRDRQGRTPLHMAATCSVHPAALEIAAYLITRGADVEGRDTSGETALMRACYCSSIHMVRLLLQRGAAVNQKTPYSRTALHYATMSENTEKVAELLRAGADPDLVDLECESPLILATQSGKLEIVKLLRQADCDLNIKGAMGYNSLHWAMITNEHQIAGYLIDEGIDVNTQSCLYRTPLHQAASTNALHIVRKLLLHAAHTEVMDSNQETPLLTACRYGNAEVVKELLLGNALTELGNFGVSALEVAVDHGFLNIAVLLMLADCDQNVLVRATSGDQADRFANFRRRTKCSAAMHHIKKFLRVFVKRPRHLQQQCRITVRRVLATRWSGYQIAENVNKLPIPEQLKDYVNRRDLMLHDPTSSNI